MTQFTLTIENKEDVSLIRKLLKKFDGVSLSPVRTKKKSAYEEALEDIANGRLTEYSSVEEAFEALNIKMPHPKFGVMV